MPDTVTWERLRELAGFRAQHRCAVSFYLNLDPREAPTAADLDSRIAALLAAAEHSATDDRQSLRAGLDRIRAWFDAEFERRGAQGVAVFAAGADNVFRPLLLSEPVPDAVKVGRTFSLAPLVRLVGRADGAIVAVVGREQGHLYRLASGRLAEIADLRDELPGRHDQGGWSQANFQRHINEHAEDHLRDVADELAQHVRRLRAADVVVVGAPETRAHFIDLLPAEARSAVIGGTQAEAHAGPSELFEVTAPLLREARLLRERECLARWREEVSRGGRAVGGWEDTLEAASDARVELLLFHDAVRRSAFQCPSCGRASAREGSCPLDGALLESCDDAVDLAVRQTLAHRGSVLAVEESRDLDPVEGIGALVRF